MLLLVAASMGLQLVFVVLGVLQFLKPMTAYQFICGYDTQLQVKFGVRQQLLFAHCVVDVDDHDNLSRIAALPIGYSPPHQMPPWEGNSGPLPALPLPEQFVFRDRPADTQPVPPAYWECVTGGWPWRSMRAAWHYPTNAAMPRVMEAGGALGTGYRMDQVLPNPDRGFIPTIYSPLALGGSLLVTWVGLLLGVELFRVLHATYRYENGRCVKCGYPIDGLPTARRCPECGCGVAPPRLLRVLGGYIRVKA